MNNIILFLLTGLLLIGCGKKEVNGEVFVVTQDAGNIKLGLVTVFFFASEQMKVAADQNSPTYLNEIRHLNISDSLNNYESCMKSANQSSNFEKDFKELAQSLTPGHSLYNQFMRNSKIYGEESEEYKKKATAHVRFTTDKRALRSSLQAFIDSAKEDIISDKTNSDGKFKVELKNNKYWVFANSIRKVGDNDEKYNWLLEYTPDGKPLYLSNDNCD